MAGSPIKNERNRIVREAILQGLTTGDDPVAGIKPFIDKLRELALAGDMSAMKEIFDRLDGKPAQQVQLSGDADSPLTVEIVRFALADTPPK